MEEFRLGHQPWGVGHQIVQHCKGLGAQGHLVWAPPQLLMLQIQARGGKTQVRCRGHRCSFWRALYLLSPLLYANASPIARKFHANSTAPFAAQLVSSYRWTCAAAPDQY